MSESAEESHCQKNQIVILKGAKYYFENDKKRLRKPARDEHRNLSKEEKIKRENMKERDTVICLKKRNKN